MPLEAGAASDELTACETASETDSRVSFAKPAPFAVATPRTSAFRGGPAVLMMRRRRRCLQVGNAVHEFIKRSEQVTAEDCCLKQERLGQTMGRQSAVSTRDEALHHASLITGRGARQMEAVDVVAP